MPRQPTRVLEGRDVSRLTARDRALEDVRHERAAAGLWQHTDEVDSRDDSHRTHLRRYLVPEQQHYEGGDYTALVVDPSGFRPLTQRRIIVQWQPGGDRDRDQSVEDLILGAFSPQFAGLK